MKITCADQLKPKMVVFSVVCNCINKEYIRTTPFLMYPADDCCFAKTLWVITTKNLSDDILLKGDFQSLSDRGIGADYNRNRWFTCESEAREYAGKKPPCNCEGCLRP